MGIEGIGSFNDYVAEHGLDPRSKEAEIGYTALLSENYRQIRADEASLDLPTISLLPAEVKT